MLNLMKSIGFIRILILIHILLWDFLAELFSILKILYFFSIYVACGDLRFYNISRYKNYLILSLLKDINWID